MAYVNEIRDSILQAAIEGRLTEHLESDSSIEELVQDIHSDKQKLIKRKAARVDKEFPPISDDEIPFEIPHNWRWIRIGEIGIYKKGPFGSSLTKSMFIPKSDTAIKVYEQKNAIQKDASLGNYYIRKSYYEDKMQGFTLESGDIIVSCAGTIGETYVLPNDMEVGIMNQALMRMNISEHINLDYFLIYFDHVLKINAQQSSQGTAIKNIPAFEVFKKMLIPLPPIEEQQRIVDRVNIIMAKLDEFSVIEQQLITLKTNFPADMRGAILQAAMQGKLTEQLVSDSSITVALEKANSEKELLLLKKGTKYPAITDEEIPYDLPDNWQWVRLRSIVYNREQKTPTDTFSYIDIGSIDNAHQQLNSTETIIEASAAPSRARKIVKFGDVIYATVRPYLHNLCIIEREFSHEPIARTGFAAMVCHSCILNRYLLHYLMSPTWDKYANATDNAKGVAYPAINDKKLYAGLIPLPPIEEQKRIVERLDTLLPLCDTLME